MDEHNPFTGRAVEVIFGAIDSWIADKEKERVMEPLGVEINDETISDLEWEVGHQLNIEFRDNSVAHHFSDVEWAWINGAIHAVLNAHKSQ